MKLKALQATLEKKQQKKAQAEAAQPAFEEGITRLAWAQESGYEMEELLGEALGHFQTAIQVYPEHTPSYLAMGYLFLLVEDYPTAQECFEAIQAYAPEDPDAQAFMNYLLDTPMPETEAFSDHGGELAEISLELLYDQTNALLDHEMIVASPYLSKQPTANLKELGELEKYLITLEDKQAILSQNISQLAQEMNITPLVMKQEPLQLISQRLQQVILSSCELYDLRNRIGLMQERVNQVAEEINRAWEPQILNQAENFIEQLLDRVDQMQDCLKDYEQQGYQVKEIKTDFDKMLFLINLVQDMLG